MSHSILIFLRTRLSWGKLGKAFCFQWIFHFIYFYLCDKAGRAVKKKLPFIKSHVVCDTLQLLVFSSDYSLDCCSCCPHFDGHGTFPQQGIKPSVSRHKWLLYWVYKISLFLGSAEWIKRFCRWQPCAVVWKNRVLY